MNTSYPHHHSYSHDVLRGALQPVCAYCLHLLAAFPAGTALSAAMRQELEDDHVCVEKMNARRPEVSLPFN